MKFPYQISSMYYFSYFSTQIFLFKREKNTGNKLYNSQEEPSHCCYLRDNRKENHLNECYCTIDNRAF